MGRLYTAGTTFVGKNPPVRINIGAGVRPLEGFINQDLYPYEGVEMVFDLNKKWKIDDDSVDEYLCLHTLEHLDDPIHFFAEVQRTLKVGGKITIEVPYGWNETAMGDPTHKRPYLASTFSSFTHARQAENSWNPQHDPSRFPYQFKINYAHMLVEHRIKKWPLWKYWALPASRYFLNIISAIRVEMERTLTDDKIKE